MIPAVAPAVPDKFAMILRIEIQREQRFYIFRVLFFEKGFYKFARCRIILIHPEVVLIAVQDCRVNIFPVRAPGHCGQIMIQTAEMPRVGIQKQRFSGFNIIDAQGYVLAGFAGHGITDEMYFGNAVVNFDQGIFCHMGLILMIKGNFITHG